LYTAVTEHHNKSGEPLDLVVCPELFSSGYNVGDQLYELADNKTGETFEAFSAVAKKLGIAVCYGYPQKVGDKLFNAAALVDAKGNLLANHQKQLNSPGSFEERYFTPGNGFTSLKYLGIEIAILICYEVEFPEAVRHVAASGAQLVLVPTALVEQWNVVASQLVPTRAFENGVWIAYANHAGHENGFRYLGGSKIVAPNGEIKVDAGLREQLISFDISTDAVKAAQSRLPYLRDFSKLHNSLT